MAMQMQIALSFLFILLSVFSFSTSATTIHPLRSKRTTFSESKLSIPQNQTTFFHVSTPITPPPNSIRCSTLVLAHDFGFTFTLPPVTATYAPPTACLRRRLPSLAVLELSAACTGIQFDRIFGVWLGGAEILRSCTAEPLATGIIWTVQKDITKYSSLLSKPQTLAVYLGNLVNNIYTGVYHVNVSIHLYYPKIKKPPPSVSVPGFGTPADLILPISRSLPINDGLWFQINNSTDIQSKEFSIPRNTFRALVEVYVSFHSSDEFWYTNPPNDFISANNLTGTLPGNGAFREVTVSLDGNLVGVVWPFTVIYTSGFNPLLWMPITGIGSFDLPTYDIEITPFLGKVLDGKSHSLGFGVTDALDVWFVDANLHLWLDSKSDYTKGSLIEYKAPRPKHTLVSNFQALDGDFDTRAHREILSTGWVKSSHGKITTNFFQRLDYLNMMQFRGDGSTQVVNQTIEFNYGIYAKNPSSVLYSEHVYRKFPLYIYAGPSNEVNDSYDYITNVTLGYNEKKFAGGRFGFFSSTLRNLQNGDGTMHVNGNSVTSALVSTREVYRYESTKGCYFRNVSSTNYNILHDVSGDSCTKELGYFPLS